MEIKSRIVTQEKIEAYHKGEKYTIDYSVTLGENKAYQNINGTIKEVSTNQIVGYVSKSYELSIRVVSGKEDHIAAVSVFTTETLALLDETINNL